MCMKVVLDGFFLVLCCAGDLFVCLCFVLMGLVEVGCEFVLV